MGDLIFIPKIVLESMSKRKHYYREPHILNKSILTFRSARSLECLSQLGGGSVLEPGTILENGWEECVNSKVIWLIDLRSEITRVLLIL